MESETCDMAGPDAVVRPISHVISAWLGAVPVRSGKSRTLVAEQISSAVEDRSQGNAGELVTHGGSKVIAVCHNRKTFLPSDFKIHRIKLPFWV